MVTARVEDFLIVEPEKALLDTLYMKSKGLAEFLTEDVDISKLDRELLELLQVQDWRFVGVFLNLYTFINHFQNKRFLFREFIAFITVTEQ